MRTLLGVLLATGLAVAAPVPKELKKDDLSRLEGEWQTIRAEVNGRESTKDFLVFTRESVNWKPSRDAADILWKLTVDPSKTPKEFAIVLTSHSGGVTYLGFYKFEGDTLTLCCKQNALPEGFSSEGAYLHVLKRAEASK